MRRQLAITALCTAILAAPLWAQRGSSRGGAPAGHASFSAGGSIGVHSGSRVSATPHFGVSGPRFVTSPRSSVRFGTNFRRPFIGPRRFHNGFYFSSFAPFYFGYYGYPAYYSDYSYSTLDAYPGYDYYAAQSGNELAQQQQDIDRLEEEVARLQEERESREVADARPPAENRSAPSTPTLLVFRDKHTQEVQNYAIVGATVWIFNEQRATRVPLSSLDIEATTKANDERGVTFRVPN